MNSSADQDHKPVSAVPHTTKPIPQYRFVDLAAGEREVWIEYAGQVYRLRLTRNEKLILNK